MSLCWLRDPAEIAHLWTLRRRGAEITALARLLPGGLELRFEFNGQFYFSRLFSTEDELTACVDEKRAELEAEGWTALDAPAAAACPHR